MAIITNKPIKSIKALITELAKTLPSVLLLSHTFWKTGIKAEVKAPKTKVLKIRSGNLKAE